MYKRQHEQGAGHAAEGYARASGRVGVCVATSGPGATNLVTAIALCPTWLQTCWFALDGEPPSRQDEDDYLEFVAALLRDGHKLQGALLYTLARPSLQAEAPRLSALPEAQLQAFAERITKLGLAVKVST